MVKLKCPNCNHNISKKWIFYSAYLDSYSCPKCNLKLQWNKFKSLSQLFGNILGFGIFSYVWFCWLDKKIFIGILLSVSFVLFFRFVCETFLPNMLFPNSFSLINEDDNNDKDNNDKDKKNR